jgi:alpha-L-fucosidase 2
MSSAWRVACGLVLALVSAQVGFEARHTTVQVVSTCPPLVVGNPDGNYIYPGVKGAIPYRGDAESAPRLDAFVPSGSSGRPVTVVIHGGNYVAGSRIAYVGQILELLSDHGLPWMSVDYRLGGARRQQEARDDVAAALGFVRCRASELGVDADRLVLLGEDTGAEIALSLLQRRLPGVVGAVSLGGKFEAEVLAPRAPGSSLLFVHGDADGEQPIAAIRQRCRPEVSSERCERIEVAGGSHRAENWWPSQWGYKKPLVRWIASLGRAPMPAAAPPASPSIAEGGPLEPGLHKRLVWDQAHGLTLDAWVPGGTADRPIALLVHGGGWEAGDRVTYIAPLFEPLAKAGIPWVSIDYRLTPDVRHDGQLDDLRRAIAFVRARARALGGNPERIVLVGESASGQMAALLASEDAGQPLAAVVSFYGVYDFEPMVKDAGPRSLPARLFGRRVLDAQTREQLKEVSPVHRVRAGMPPLLLVHGTAESLWAQATAYSARLAAAGVAHELVRLDGAPHGMENWLGNARWERAFDRVVAFVTAARRPAARDQVR